MFPEQGEEIACDCGSFPAMNPRENFYFNPVRIIIFWFGLYLSRIKKGMDDQNHLTAKHQLHQTSKNYGKIAIDFQMALNIDAINNKTKNNELTDSISKSGEATFKVNVSGDAKDAKTFLKSRNLRMHKVLHWNWVL